MKGDILWKALLILVYLETLYFLSPDYPHNAPTITLDIVNKKDVS